jgi:hypothetical protein
MAVIIEFAFYLLMDVIMYALGRATIFIFILGHVRAENAKEMISMRNQACAGRDSKLTLPALAAKVIGIAVFTALLMLYSSFKT